MRETSPLSFFGTSASQALSFLRWITRRALMPHVSAATDAEAQLRERHAHLQRPARGVARHRRLPDGVPGHVLEVVVVEGRVALHAGGAHLEQDARAVIVVRVEQEREGVGLEGGVAPRELARDRLGRAVEQPHARVERAVVDSDPELGLLARRLALLGIALDEAGRGRRRPPVGFVEPAVDLDPARGARGPDDALRDGSGGRRGGSEPRRRQQ